MSTVIDIRDLTSRMDEIIALTATGHEVILSDGITPRARLVPIPPSVTRVAGLHTGAMQMSPDFDAPLPDDFWTGKS